MKTIQLRLPDGRKIEADVLDESDDARIAAALVDGYSGGRARFVADWAAYRNPRLFASPLEKLLPGVALEAGNAQDTSQVAKDYDPFFRSYPLTGILPPPVPPNYYVEVYRRCPTTRAVVDARVAAVVGLGFSIRYRPDVAWAGAQTALKKPDRAALQRRDIILGVIEDCGTYPSFQQLLEAAWKDVELTGNGFVEIVRDGSGVVSGFRHLPSVQARLSDDYRVVYQVSDFYVVQAFALYGSDARFAVMEPVRQKTGKSTRTLWKAAGLHKDISPVEMAQWEAEGKEIRPTHEVLHLKHYSPMHPYYGEPPILSAIEDYLGGLYARLFNISYFNAATVPRMMIIIKGGELNPQVERAIQDFLREQESMEALNQCLLVAVQEGVDVQIERLSSEQLRDAGFLEYRQQCDDGIRQAYRVPKSWLGIVEGGGRQQATEVNQKFLYSVVRPHQAYIEATFNRVFRERLGVSDWALVLHQHQAMDWEVFANWAERLRRNGIATINELRQEIGLAPIEGGDIAHIMPMGMGVVPVQYLDYLGRALEEGRADVMELPNPADGMRPMGMAIVAEPGLEKLAGRSREEWLKFLTWLRDLAESGTLEGILSMVMPGGTTNEATEATED